MRLRQKQQVPLIGNCLEHFDPRLCRRHDPQIKQLAKTILNHVERDTAFAVHTPRTAAIRPYLHPRTDVRKVLLTQINVH